MEFTEAHWQDVRERAAIAAMQGLLASPKWIPISYQHYAKVAIEYANELVKQLKKK